jgi:hypothetical protein
VLAAIRGSERKKTEERGDETSGAEKAERLFTGVEAEQFRKERRAAAEGTQSAGEEGRVAIHEKKEIRHEMRATRDTTVRLLIQREIAGGDGLGEGEGLLETEGEAVAGDGVDRAGGVADEADVAMGDPPKRAGESDGSAGDSGGSGVTESGVKGGKQGEMVPCGRA